MEAKCHGNSKPDFGKVRNSIEKYILCRKYDDLTGAWETNEEWRTRSNQGLADFDKWVEEAKA